MTNDHTNHVAKGLTNSKAVRNGKGTTLFPPYQVWGISEKRDIKDKIRLILSRQVSNSTN